LRTLITLSYDGTNYCGWQRQNGQLSVQEAVETALSDLYKRPVRVLGASRTDSGVHALCQKAAFSTPDFRIPAERLYLALNSKLPEDIRAVLSEQKNDSFHVINDVKHKTYSYNIQNSGIYSPTLMRYTHFVKEPLNVDKMSKAAEYFVGTHDFKAFSAANGSAQTSKRTIYECCISKNADIITMLIRGNGFLYNMIRIITGTLIDVGQGRITPEHCKYVIECKDRSKAGITAPAKGLTLEDIKY
jgi:tRNA pseudouridine38-40 synthase